jgi:hypothetical protein
MSGSEPTDRAPDRDEAIVSGEIAAPAPGAGGSGEPVGPPPGETGAGSASATPAPPPAAPWTASAQPGPAAPTPSALPPPALVGIADDPDDPYALGAAGRRGRGERDGRRASRGSQLGPRARVVALAAAALAVIVAVASWLGYQNSRAFFLACGTETARAARGSVFPWWGRSALRGPAWRPIRLPPRSACSDTTFATQRDLETVFTSMLIREASARLTTGDAADVDEAERQLDQALLLTRARPDRRVEIERLRGSVAYWRGVSRVRAVIEELDGAAELFQAAADAQARNTDAGDWASHARGLAGELRRGPPSLRGAGAAPPAGAPPIADTDTAPAPNQRGSGPEAADMTDAGAPPPGAARAGEEHTPPVPEAGLPTGGVLL